MELLLAADGIDVNKQNLHKRTALTYASEQGHTEVVEVLLRVNDICVNLHGKKNDTALIRASF